MKPPFQINRSLLIAGISFIALSCSFKSANSVAVNANTNVATNETGDADPPGTPAMAGAEAQTGTAEALVADSSRAHTGIDCRW